MEKKYPLELTKEDIDFIVDALIHKKERAAAKSTFEQCGALIDCLDVLLEEEGKTSINKSESRET